MQKAKILSLAALVFCFSPCVPANPLGGVVGSGAASITPSGDLLTISQSSSTAIINWNTFNIAAGESTVFEFNGAAGANSAVLNLVTAGNGGSTLAGSLSSTVGHLGPVGGTVLLLNPDGILFAPGATVNVGSLVATTLGLSDQNEFLNGSTLHFNGTSTAGIQNQGSLTALGDIFLIAHTVQNSGALSAGNEAGLAAGTTVTLAQSGAERLTVVAGTGTGTPIGVNNAAGGVINAVTTELKAAGGNIYALAINNGGAIHATSLVNQNGHIFMRATDSTTGNQGPISSSGTITVDAVNVTAADVTLQGSQVDLSGTVNAGSGPASSVTVTTTYGTGVNGTGNINVDNNAQITAGAVSLHSGTDGTGGILFGAGVTIAADAQTYQAGIGDGSQATAVANLTGNSPTFLNQAGNGSPTAFIFEQDANIADANIPVIAQFFNNAPPANYTIQSAGGGLTLDTGTKVAGSALTLSAPNATLTINADLANNSLISLNASGALIVLNNNVTTSAGQTYDSPVKLGADTTLTDTAGGNVIFAKAVDGAYGLAINTAGNIVFNGAVGINTALSSLTTDGSGTVAGQMQLNGGSVTTTGGQTYNDTVTLGAATILSSTTVGLNGGVAFNGHTLDLNNSGQATFGGLFDTFNLLTFGGSVALGAATTLDGTTFNLPAVNGNGNNLTLGNSGLATLNSAVSGLGTLTIGGTGTLKVGSTIAAGSVADSEGTMLSGSSVTTSGGGQTYNDQVTLGADVTLADTGAGNVTFNATVNGAYNLEINTAGNEVFNALAGNVTALNSLTTDGSGTVGGHAEINGGGVNTSGGQTYNDGVILGADAMNSGTTISYNGTVSGAENLTDSGSTAFGSSVNVGSLTDNGSTAINGGGVTTTAGQTYNGPVTLGADAMNSGTTIFYNGAVSGAKNLIDSGSTAFGSSVNVGSLTDNGSTAINGGGVTTTAGQTYSGPVTLGADAMNSGTTISYNGAVSGAKNLIDSGATAFGSSVNVGSLTDNGSTAINGGGVTTTAGQTYNGPVTLGKDTILNGSFETFAPNYPFTANGYKFTVNQVFYNILDEEEDTKRILGAVLPTYQQVNVGRQKPVKVGIRTGLPPWMITAPKNSLEVPFEQDVADMFYRN